MVAYSLSSPVRRRSDIPPLTTVEHTLKLFEASSPAAAQLIGPQRVISVSSVDLRRYARGSAAKGKNAIANFK